MLIIKNLIGDSSVKILGLLKTIFLIPFLIRYLGVADYGLYTYLLALIGMITILFDFGTHSYGDNYYNNAKTDEKKYIMGTIYAVNIISLSLILLAGFLFNEQLSRIVNIPNDYVYPVIILSSFTGIFVFISTIGLFQKKLRKYYISNLSFSIFNGLIIIWVIYFQSDILSFIWYLALLQLIFTIIAIVYFSEFTFLIKFNLNRFKNILSHSLYFILGGAVFAIVGFTDRYLIKYYMTDYDLGIYGLVFVIISILMSVFGSLIFPIIKINLIQSIKQNKKPYVLNDFFVKSINLVIIPLIMGLACYGLNFVIFYAGNDFKQSYSILPILLVLAYIQILLFLYIEEFIMRNKTAIKILLKYQVVMMILNVIMNIVLIPEYGLYGASIASVIAYIFYFVCVLYLTDNLKLSTLSQFKFLLPAIPIWGIGYYLWNDNYGFWLMWVVCIASMLIYWLLIYLLYNKDMQKFLVKLKEINR